MGAFQPLLAGNTVVYKLSEEVPMFGQLLDRLMAAASCQPACSPKFMAMAGWARPWREATSTPSFSRARARWVASSIESPPRKFIPVHLELGGSDAGVVCEDANIDDAGAANL